MYRKGQGKPNMHVLLWDPGNSAPVTELKWPAHREASLLTPVCGEGKYSVYYKAPSVRSSKNNWQLMLKRPELPSGF